MTDVAFRQHLLPSNSLLVAQSGGIEASVAELGRLPIWILCGYLVLLLIIVLVGWLKSRAGEEDYYLAGRGQGWIVSSLTIMATFFSSFALLGAPGVVYREGVMFSLYSLNVPVAGVCVYLIGSRIWKAGRAFHYVTPGNMVADYYGDHSRAALKILVAIAGLLYVTSEGRRATSKTARPMRRQRGPSSRTWRKTNAPRPRPTPRPDRQSTARRGPSRYSPGTRLRA